MTEGNTLEIERKSSLEEEVLRETLRRLPLVLSLLLLNQMKDAILTELNDSSQADK